MTTYSSTQWSVLLPVVLTLIAIQEDEGGFFNKVKKFCYPQWAIEAFILANASRSDQDPSILVYLIKILSTTVIIVMLQTSNNIFKSLHGFTKFSEHII